MFEAPQIPPPGAFSAPQTARADDPKAPGVLSLSNRHQAILEYLMAHPTEKLGVVAQRFGVSQSWLSCVIHSDAFQAQLRARQDVTFHATVLPIREKITHIAHRALDRLDERLELNEMSDTEVRKTADDMLAAIGFGAGRNAGVGQQAGVTINNYVGVDRDVLAQAREKIGSRNERFDTLTIDPLDERALPQGDNSESEHASDSSPTTRVQASRER